MYMHPLSSHPLPCAVVWVLWLIPNLDANQTAGVGSCTQWGLAHCCCGVAGWDEGGLLGVVSVGVCAEVVGVGDGSGPGTRTDGMQQHSGLLLMECYVECIG